MVKSTFKFSVIIPIYNAEKYVGESIESIINQTLDFKKNIQLILINDGSSDNSEDICLKYKNQYPNNIIYKKQKNAGVSVARNYGIKLAEGEFLTFLDSDDLWSLDSFKTIYRSYQKHPDISVFSCKMVFFDAKTGDHPLNYKYAKNKIVDISKDYQYPQLSSSSLFIKREIIERYAYDKTIKYSEDNKFINEIILDLQKYMVLKKPIYYYRKRFAGDSAIQSQTKNVDWYLVTPEKVYKYLYNLSKEKYGRVIEYIQYLVIYDISWRNIFNPLSEIDGSVRDKYTELLVSLIKETDDKIILAHRHLSFSHKCFLLGLKQGKKEIKYRDNKIYLNDYGFEKNKIEDIFIDSFYIRKNKISIYGRLDQKIVPRNQFHVLNSEKEVNIEYYSLANDYNHEAFNGEALGDFIGIHIEIPLEEMKRLAFYSQNSLLFPKYPKVGSLFTEFLPCSYHHVNKKITIVRKGCTLVKQKRNFFRSFYYEFRNELTLLKNRKIKNLSARLVTKVGRIFKRKELWLISDRVDRADDNGEHFFKYMVENHPNKNIYFVLTSNSPDYERLSKIGKVIDPNSKKYKLMVHRADYIISSHAEEYIFNPLGKMGKYIQDQYHFKFVFLQHGIIKDDLSSWLNANTKKIDMFVTTCPLEYQSLLDYNYCYGEEIVKLTGLPRYDSLLEKSKTIQKKKQIMLSLTWRNSLASKISKESGKRIYNEKFKESDYFHFINNLMNDKKLLKVLEKENYKIRFIPHPNVLCQLEDFDKNEYVEIEEKAISYQKEFCENSLLITDYSSVFFDFAYLKKPVIYYQADEEEFYKGQIYNQGYFDYKKMGFGPVYDNYDKFITELINLIENDCKLEKKYADRIDSFYAFHDNKNCERVYEEIINLDKE